MSTKYSTSLVTAFLLSLPLALNAHAAEPALQLGAGFSTVAQVSGGQSFGFSTFQPHLGTVGLAQHSGGVALFSSNAQLGPGAPVRPGAVPHDGSGRRVDAAQTPNTETEHTTLILAALLMVGMVVSRRLMR